MAAAAVGHAFIPRDSVLPAIVTVGIVCLAMVPFDLGIKGMRVPGVQRQTNKVWRHRYGERGSAVLWGLHLGLGFLTIRVTSLYWAALLLTASLASPPLGALSFSAYGIGLGLNLVVGGSILEGTEFERPLAALRLLPQIHRVSAALLMLFGLALTLIGLLAALGP